MSVFTRAIVRPPSANFSAGLTTANLGMPDYATALRQHSDYCDALRSCGLTVITLPVDDQFPDSTFLEDNAILAGCCAAITRSGAQTRRGEEIAIEMALREWFDDVAHIEAPGTVDGGDICEAGNHFFIGISKRTNEAGARQLAQILQEHNYSSEFVDVRHVNSILHLKSGVAYLGDNRLVVIDELAGRPQFRRYELVVVDKDEEYAANCVRVNDTVLIAAGFPLFAQRLSQLGYSTLSLNMSEFEKMDGGLSCLSLRF